MGPLPRRARGSDPSRTRLQEVSLRACSPCFVDFARNAPGSRENRLPETANETILIPLFV